MFYVIYLGGYEIKDEDVRIGMKVVPHDKTAGQKGLKASTTWEVAKDDRQNYLYVRGKDEGAFVLSNKENYGIAELFNASDFEPYIDIADVVYQRLANAINNFSELGKELIKAFGILQVWAEKNRDAIESFAKKTEKERLDEEIAKSFEAHVKKHGNDFSLFSCYKAGYIAGRESK